MQEDDFKISWLGNMTHFVHLDGMELQTKENSRKMRVEEGITLEMKGMEMMLRVCKREKRSPFI